MTRFMKQLFLFLFFFLVTTSHSFAEGVFNAKSAMLDNGLEIVVVENHRVPVVTHMVWYNIGAADEILGKSGAAHFLEHLMFKGHSYSGLGSYEPGEFSRIVRSIGGEDNAFTSQDYTAYYQSVSVGHLEEMMRIEAARMRGLDVPAEEVSSENKVICEERRQRTDNNPRAQLAEKMDAALFPVHPYGIPVIGWMAEMQELDWDIEKDFYTRYYAPNNAILVVSGDITLEQVVEMAQRTYGLLPAGEDLPLRVRAGSNKPIPPHAPLIMHHENVRQPLFQRLYRVPSYRQDAKASLALEVLEEILGAPSTGRLYNALVVEEKLASNISFYYSGSAWDDGRIGISATPNHPDDIDALRRGINKELSRMAQDGPSADEVSDALRRLTDSAVFARDSISAPAMIIGRNMVTGTPLADIENWPDMIAGVTPEDVQNVAYSYLNPDILTDTPPVEGVLLPEEIEGE